MQINSHFFHIFLPIICITVGIVVEGAAEAIVIVVDDLGKRFRQEDVIRMDCMGEEWRYLVGRKAGYAAADRRNEEGVFGMRLGKRDELIHIGTDGIHPTLHGRDGVGSGPAGRRPAPIWRQIARRLHARLRRRACLPDYCRRQRSRSASGSVIHSGVNALLYISQ